MQALVWTAAHRLELLEVEEPQIALPDEVKIRIEMTGICGTDLAVVTGKEEGVHGIIRGHEAVGTVVETGSAVDRVKVGDRVVIDPNESCGECDFCQRNKPHLCLGIDGEGMRIAGLNAQGTFAPLFVTRQRFVHPLPPTVSAAAAVLVEPLACVIHNFNEAKVSPDDSVLILGSGPMGILCQVVSASFARLTAATEVNEYRLECAKSVCDAVFTPDELNEGNVRKLLGNRKFDVVIDTVGTQLHTAEQWVERGGTIIPFGINGVYRHTISPTAYIQKAIKLIGAGEYRHTFEQALRFAARHPEIAQLVTRSYRLDEHEKAINELLGYELDSMKEVISRTVKTVFKP
ncbi:zinc-dependent alcohol dehydrogenase [Paenibacillus sp. MMS18-CY102]|uniref:zinc-dependent alcohol dehydrogenase n=1 Tax=Paenibacillus sp. MMS18-CY102 TaxID=2682849 RepID=UPI0013665050|nr:alcohol dehydrogenase catalytic domain-containing protein [Paenibacillus sp. MMS18-CY102]MWC26996.1 alcohol dehydrogenase catalytic domain-containing protein [Paenibacillus sp. MMS18-CY102]